MAQQFGQNFKDNLLSSFNKSKLEETKKFITHFLEVDSLMGHTFLDAGCGSGVFTLAATELGADVFSFDIDDVAIQNTKKLLTDFGYTYDDSKIIIGDILQPEFIQSIDRFDYVMCWGVAHHTGQMWKSIDSVCHTVKDGGVLHLGIYNKADGWGFYPDGRFGPSGFWRKIKRFYSRLPSILQSFTDVLATVGIVCIYMVTFNNPIKKLKENERRGMNWQSDLKDWLIGYPYEYATPEEVFLFMKKRGFSLTNLRTNNGLLTNNYVFRKDIKNI
jgi:SAM-dependent methyltransferase